MDEIIISTNAKLNSFKKLCYAQLWLLVLFVPFIVAAVLLVQSLQFSRKQDVKINNNNVATIDITPTELATIMTKPLSELLLMEVYFDGRKKKSNQSAALALDTKGMINDIAYEKPSYQNRDKSSVGSFRAN